MTDTEQLQKIYQDFQQQFPLDALAEMPLDEYTNLNKTDSFCFWLESRTQALGSIWGGSSYKFGIYRYNKAPNPNDPRIHFDRRYAWYAKYNAQRSWEAYLIVRNTILKIAIAARSGEYESIDDIIELGDAYKWKIAFLYSQEKLLPIYKKEYLLKIANKMGGDFKKNSKVSQLQRFLISLQGDRNIYDYYDNLWKLHSGTVQNPSESEEVSEAINEDAGNHTGADENPERDYNPIPITKHIPYSRKDFLSEVYVNESDFDKLRNNLLQNKNLILQGAPGVGKTFSAKRLAYAIMGEKDDSRIEMVQFHQNYSYEDLIMGFKPTENGGFELRTGSFYDFCIKASKDPDRPYFFIIDEINRGNISKIFGELLMLIEKSYRGLPIRLAYRKEMFSVPANLHIIGMMNTADRSLALIDYALRRRFRFFPLSAGFNTEGFKSEIARHHDLRVKKVIDAVESLNTRIAEDESLGTGFMIGHSYFCQQPDNNDWIENVVKYEICPMLDEYWFDNKEKCEQEKKQLLDLL